MSPYTLVASWFVSAMAAWVPPQASWYPDYDNAKSAGKVNHPEIMETKEQMEHRYRSIADNLITVVYDLNYKNFTGSRAKDAMYALNIMRYESGGFRKDVDSGVFVGDYGHSPCMMAVWMPPKHIHPGLSITKEGWTNIDIRYDRVKCFVTGTDRMRSSWNMCSGYNILDRLSGYTIGHCKASEPQSRSHSVLAYEWIRTHPVPVTDEEVLEFFANIVPKKLD